MPSPNFKPKHHTSLPAYDGPYSVGLTDFEVPASHLPSYYDAPDSKISTVHFAIFYPCEKPANDAEPQEPITWIPSPQKENMRAFARFMGVSSRFSKFFSKFPRRLRRVTLPAFKDAVMLQPPNERWPVLVFSHGIGGTRHTYSHLLGSLASHGVVVIAPDHRDGTGPYSHIKHVSPASLSDSESSIENSSGENLKLDHRLSGTPSGDGSIFVEYELIPHKFNEDVMSARRRQLKVRLWELALVYEAVVNIDLGYNVLQPRKSDTGSLGSGASTDSFNGIFDHIGFSNKLDIHEPGKVVWAGHSFGAATTVQFVKTVYYSYSTDKSGPAFDCYEPLLEVPKQASILGQITPQTQVCLLDMWTYPLLDMKTRWLWNKPLPSYNENGPGGAAVLAIISYAFTKWDDNYRLVKKIVSDSPAAHSWTTDKPRPYVFYAHFSAHLSQSDFPLLFPSIVKKVLKAKEPERLLCLNMRSILQMMTNNGATVVTPALMIEDYFKTKKIAEKDMPTEQMLQNRQILSREGGLRNWAPVPIDEGNNDLAFDIDKEFDLSSGETFLPNKK